MLNATEICGNKKKNGVANDVDIPVDIQRIYSWCVYF